MDDTIFAEATALGRAGLSVIRISGPLAWKSMVDVMGPVPKARVATLRTLKDTQGNVIDQGLILCFAQGESFTGEQTVELQSHGSRAVVARLLAVLSTLEGFRPAKPGEFTRRALENGKMDLTQVEGLADLINADTEAQRKQAMQSLRGELSDLAGVWRSQLIRCSALLEATMDFSDEEVPDDVSDDVLAILDGVRMELARQVQGADVSERIRDGFEVAIIGRPNVGKSTLLNFLAGRKAAITSETAGTTRDVVEVQMDLGGLPVTLLDTAGLRDTADSVEMIGVEVAKERASAADLRLFLVGECDNPKDFEISIDTDDIVVGTKADLGNSKEQTQVSGLTGVGVEALVLKITDTLSKRAARASSATRQRHVQSMQAAIGALESAKLQIEESPDSEELAAEEIRSSITCLDELIGRVGVEDILDVVFRDFCIGK